MTVQALFVAHEQQGRGHHARRVSDLGDQEVLAQAVEELEQAGTFDDITQLGSGQDDIDRQLAQLTTASSVDDELAKLKTEVGGGSAPPAIAPPPGAEPAPGPTEGETA